MNEGGGPIPVEAQNITVEDQPTELDMPAVDPESTNGGVVDAGTPVEATDSAPAPTPEPDNEPVIASADKNPEKTGPDKQALKDQKIAQAEQKASNEIVGLLLREKKVDPATINEYMKNKLPPETLAKLLPTSTQDELQEILDRRDQAIQDIEDTFVEPTVSAQPQTPEAQPQKTLAETKAEFLGENGKIAKVVRSKHEAKVRAAEIADIEAEAATQFQSQGGGDWGQFRDSYLEAQKQIIEDRVKTKLDAVVAEEMEKIRNGEISVGEFLKDLPDYDVNKSKMEKAIEAFVQGSSEAVKFNWENSSFDDFMNAFFGRGDAGFGGISGRFDNEKKQEETISVTEFKTLLVDPDQTKRFAKAFEEAYSAKGAALVSAGFEPSNAAALFQSAKEGNRQSLSLLTQELLTFLFDARSEEVAASRWAVVKTELGDKLYPTKHQALSDEVFDYLKELKKPAQFAEVFAPQAQTTSP